MRGISVERRHLGFAKVTLCTWADFRTTAGENSWNKIQAGSSVPCEQSKKHWTVSRERIVRSNFSAGRELLQFLVNLTLFARLQIIGIFKVMSHETMFQRCVELKIVVVNRSV